MAIIALPYRCNRTRESKKLLPLTDSGWQVQFAGNGAIAEKIVAKAAASYDQKPTMRDSYEEMVTCLEAAFRSVRENEATETILRPRLLDRDLVFKRSSIDLHPLNDELVTEISAQLADFKTDCILLVSGFDKAGPHIFTIADPGIVSSCDLAGFCAIGIGHEAATSRLLWEEVDRKNSLPSVLFDVFHAKVQAEVIVGVGYRWDAHVITRDKNLMTLSRPVIGGVSQLVEKRYSVATVERFY